MNFKGKTALVTGAAVGIGRAAALVFAERGANLVLVDMNYEKLKDVKKETEKLGADTLIYQCDVSDEENVNSVVKSVSEHFGGIDILVNNAALWRAYKGFLEMTTDEWNTYFNINVMGTVFFSKAVLPYMIENKWGRIVNVSSVAGVYGNGNMTTYSATKGAVNSLSKALAREFSQKGILINSICPGTVSPSDNPDIDYYTENDLSVIGRTGTDRENANLICFLASEEASYISGQVIQIDGCRKILI